MASDTPVKEHPLAKDVKAFAAQNVNFIFVFIFLPLLGLGFAKVLNLFDVTLPWSEENAYTAAQLTGMIGLMFVMAAVTLVVPWCVALWYLRKDSRRTDTDIPSS